MREGDPLGEVLTPLGVTDELISDVCFGSFHLYPSMCCVRPTPKELFFARTKVGRSGCTSRLARVVAAAVVSCPPPHSTAASADAANGTVRRDVQFRVSACVRGPSPVETCSLFRGCGRNELRPVDKGNLES